MKEYWQHVWECAILMAIGLFLILVASGALSGCKTEEKIRAAIWMNNGHAMAPHCEANPELRKFGFYRQLNGGKIEFKPFCDPDSKQWLSMHERDIQELILRDQDD